MMPSQNAFRIGDWVIDDQGRTWRVLWVMPSGWVRVSLPSFYQPSRYPGDRESWSTRDFKSSVLRHLPEVSHD